MSCIINDIETTGYSVCDPIDIADFDLIFSQIDKQWRCVLSAKSPDVRRQIVKRSVHIEDYHSYCTDDLHSVLWPKTSRKLHCQAAEMVLASKFLSHLSSLLGEFSISDEENLGFPNLYWRLVRPNKYEDIGPPHRDSWFWEFNSSFKQSISYKRRLKVWIATSTVPKLIGLLVSKYSHLDPTINYVSEPRHGINMPLLADPNRDYGLELLNLKPGQAVVFHDNLLHGGAINRSLKTRISLDFTLLLH
jgi:hypothetical protein